MPLFLKHTAVGEVELQEHPQLVPEAGQLLVKVNIAGGNPVDVELNQSVPVIGSTVGYDFAGTVVSVSPEVSRFTPGQRIAGYTMGCSSHNQTWGAFGEYCIGFDYLSFHIPEDISDEQAVTLPVGLSVAGLSLVNTLKLEAGEPLVIIGGATNMGAIAIQVAKSIGAKPVVASVGKKSNTYVEALGVDAIVDYSLPEGDYVAQCKEKAPGAKKVMDSRSHGNTFRIAGEIVGSGGIVAALNPPEDPSPDVTYDFINSFSSFGVGFSIFGFEFPANPDLKKFLQDWYPSVAEKLVVEGKVQPHKYKVIEGGLLGVKQGWELYRSGQVSAEKLIYRVSETEGIKA